MTGQKSFCQLLYLRLFLHYVGKKVLFEDARDLWLQYFGLPQGKMIAKAAVLLVLHTEWAEISN